MDVRMNHSRVKLWGTRCARKMATILFRNRVVHSCIKIVTHHWARSQYKRRWISHDISVFDNMNWIRMVANTSVLRNCRALLVKLLPGVTLLSSQCLRNCTAAKSLICCSFFILLTLTVLRPQSTRILSIAGCSSGPAAVSSSWIVCVKACRFSWSLLVKLPWIQSRILAGVPSLGLLELRRAGWGGFRRYWSRGALDASTLPGLTNASMGPMALALGRAGADGAGGGLPEVLCDICCLRRAFSSFNFSICSSICWLGSFGAFDSTNLTISSPNLLMVSNFASQSCCTPSSLIPMIWWRSKWGCL